MVMISSVESFQPWVAEHRSLGHWTDHEATLTSKTEGAWCLRRDREARSWGGWPVAASSEMEAKEAWLGGGAAHDQLLTSFTLNFSPLSETLPFQIALAKHPTFPHFFTIKACWLASLKDRIWRGCFILIIWYHYPPDTTHSVERRKLHCSDTRHQIMKGRKTPRLKQPPKLSKHKHYLPLPSS